ncbi:hypothetical protein ATANTOWER_019473 [Ataeniobius toweri]|uniref:Uncharacterized protein n=1 Tax=Ataeniobius toweri TaxID=208326 RepID=A0ABU7CI57_9TELE|nr:hypothetical protein [Ataeniobius toweri]
MDSPPPGTPTISVSCHPRTWTPSESDDDILNTPFIAETSPPPVIRQVSCRSRLRSLIIDHQSQLHSTTPSPWPQPEIDSLRSSKSKTHGRIALRSERSTCSLSQHRHSPTDAAVASMLQGSSAASTQLDIKTGPWLAFSRCDNKSRLFQLLTTPSSPAAVSIPPGLLASSSTSASSMNVSGDVTAQLASRPEPISTAPPSGNQVPSGGGFLSRLGKDISRRLYPHAESLPPMPSDLSPQMTSSLLPVLPSLQLLTLINL